MRHGLKTPGREPEKPAPGVNSRTEDRRQKTEDRRQKTEDRRQRTEDRRQRTEDPRQRNREACTGGKLQDGRPMLRQGFAGQAMEKDKA